MVRLRPAIHLLASAALLAACGGDQDRDGAPPAAVVVTSRSVEALGPTEQIEVDLGDPTTVWVFDRSGGAMDLTRVVVVSAHHTVTPMVTWLEAVAATLSPTMPDASIFALGSGTPEDVGAALNATLPTGSTYGDCTACFECGEHAACENTCVPTMGPSPDTTGMRPVVGTDPQINPPPAQPPPPPAPPPGPRQR